MEDTPTAEIEEKPLVCVHYWIIDPANGSVSIGICQTCWIRREFKNYVEGADWGNHSG